MVAGRRQQGTLNQVANVDAGADGCAAHQKSVFHQTWRQPAGGSIVYEMAFMMATCCVTRT
jgi:hypothetical protein